MCNTQNWALILKASSNSLYSASCHLFLSVCSLNLTLTFFPSGLRKLWTLFLRAQVWAQEPYSVHLSLGVQPAPLPNRALSPFPLLGPRFVIQELTCPWSAGFPTTSYRMGSKRLRSWVSFSTLYCPK